MREVKSKLAQKGLDLTPPEIADEVYYIGENREMSISLREYSAKRRSS